MCVFLFPFLRSSSRVGVSVPGANWSQLSVMFTPVSMFHLVTPPFPCQRIFTEVARYRKDYFSTCPEDRPLLAQFCANDPHQAPTQNDRRVVCFGTSLFVCNSIIIDCLFEILCVNFLHFILLLTRSIVVLWTHDIDYCPKYLFTFEMPSGQSDSFFLKKKNVFPQGLWQHPTSPRIITTRPCIHLTYWRGGTTWIGKIIVGKTLD